MANRELPNNAQAEAGLLSIFLNDGDGDVLTECLEQRLKPEMFFSKKYRLIFCSCVELYTDVKPINKENAIAVLKKRGKLGEVGESEINALADNKENAVHASHYVEILKDKAFRRKLIKTATNAVDANLQDKTINRELLDIITKTFLNAGGNITPEGVAEADVCRRFVYERVKALFVEAKARGFRPHGTLRLLTRLVWYLNRRTFGE